MPNAPLDHRFLRVWLKGRALSILARVLARKLPERPITVRVRSEEQTLTLILGTPGNAPMQSVSAGGLFFSPLEAAIVNAIGPDGCLIGKEIAGACGQKYTGRFKVILNNLGDREILTREGDRQGYRWHPSYLRSREKKLST